MTDSVLSCPTCTYDLRKSRVGRGRFRCPECGALTNITAINQAHDRRVHGRRQVVTAVGVAALAVGVLLIARRFGMRASIEAGHGAVFIVATLMLLVLTATWLGCPWRYRLMYALGGAGLVVLLTLFKIGLATVLLGAGLIAWVACWRMWSISRQFY